MSQVSKSKRIRIDPEAVNQKLPQTIEETQETPTIESLPDDMLQVITSFLWLIDIHCLRLTCKVLNKICQINTYQIICYRVGDKYYDYMNFYKKRNTPYIFKHIKKLKIYLFHSCDVQILGSVMGLHVHLETLDIVLWRMDESIVQTFASKIPLNIRINELRCRFTLNNSLILKSNKVFLTMINLTNDNFTALNDSNVSHITLQDCFFGNVTKINLKNWISLKSMQLKIVTSDFINSLWSHPPHLCEVHVVGISNFMMNVTGAFHLGNVKNLKLTITREYELKIYKKILKCIENCKVEQFYFVIKDQSLTLQLCLFIKDNKIFENKVVIIEGEKTEMLKIYIKLIKCQLKIKKQWSCNKHTILIRNNDEITIADGLKYLLPNFKNLYLL